MSVWTDGSFPLSLSLLTLPHPVVGQRCAGRCGLLAAGRWWGTSGMRGSRVAAVPLSCERWQAEGGEGEGRGGILCAIQFALPVTKHMCAYHHTLQMVWSHSHTMPSGWSQNRTHTHG